MVLIVVVVPLTVKFPATVRLDPIERFEPIKALLATPNPPLTVNEPPFVELEASVVDDRVATPLTVRVDNVPTLVIFG